MTQRHYSKRGYVVSSRLHELIEDKAKIDGVKKSVIISELSWFCGITKEQIYSIPKKTLGSVPVALLMARYFDCKVEDIFSVLQGFESE